MKNSCLVDEQIAKISHTIHPRSWAPMTVIEIFRNPITQKGGTFHRWFLWNVDNDICDEVIPYSGPYMEYSRTPGYELDPEWKPLMKYNRTTGVMSKI